MAAYFDVIKSNGAALYCCNRVDKLLYGGERLQFDSYPWGEGELVFNELCPWFERGYYS